MMIDSSRSFDQKFASEIVQVKEKERLKLARELHDEMAQYLTSIHLYTNSIIRSRTSTSIDDAKAIDQVVTKILNVIHNKIKKLRSNELSCNERNFTENLDGMIQSWKFDNPDISMSFHIKGTFTDVDSNVLFTVSRLAQECLTNITRHSQACSVMISIERLGNYLIMKVVDDGKGFSLDEEVGRFGIVGMRERVAECGGEFRITTSINAGVNIHVFLPCGPVSIRKGELL